MSIQLTVSATRECFACSTRRRRRTKAAFAGAGFAAGSSFRWSTSPIPDLLHAMRKIPSMPRRPALQDFEREGSTAQGARLAYMLALIEWNDVHMPNWLAEVKRIMDSDPPGNGC